MNSLPGQAQPDIYTQLLAEKTKRTLEEFACFSPPELTVLPSPTSHFRMRAEFGIWHNELGAHYAMYDINDKSKRILIEEFTIGSQLINDLMPRLIAEVNQSSLLKTKLFQIEFLTTLSGDALITLIYHRHLDNEWLDHAKELASRLNIKIIGRSRKQKLMTHDDFVIECLHVNHQPYHYKQIEGGFTQPNARVCEKMLSWVQNQCGQQQQKDLLELYCGNGNFTVALANRFRKVLATEIAKTSCRAAQDNFVSNNIHNVEIARLSSEEITQALNKVREFRRLQHLNLDDYQFSTILVDPPRAGLDERTLLLCSGFERIIYISCNPITLHDNMKALEKTHRIRAWALFDQFPYTDHRECGLILERHY